MSVQATLNRNYLYQSEETYNEERHMTKEGGYVEILSDDRNLIHHIV